MDKRADWAQRKKEWWTAGKSQRKDPERKEHTAGGKSSGGVLDLSVLIRGPGRDNGEEARFVN